MLDPETFLTEVYVLADDFCKTQPDARRPGPAAALTPSEVLTLALFAQWRPFPSEAAFHRYACRRLRPLFPTLPSRPQLNRLIRRCHDLLVAFALHLGQAMATGDDRSFEAVDGTGVVTRNAKRRGVGWLGGEADIGHCTRLGWYEGVRLLLAVTPTGAVTGWGIGPASTNDRVLAETFFAARATPQQGLACVGQPTGACYVADMGFAGRDCEARWQTDYQATVVCPAPRDSARAWSKPWRTWLAGIRQVIEAVNDRLLDHFGLDHERPHTLTGLQARLAATIGLHNVCCWLNRTRGRGPLMVADLVDW